jgi:hypothetical protein
MLITNSSNEFKLQANHLVDALQRNVTTSLLLVSFAVVKNLVTVRLIYQEIPPKEDEYINDIIAEFESRQIDMKVQPFIVTDDLSSITDSEYIVYKKHK